MTETKKELALVPDLSSPSAIQQFLEQPLGTLAAGVTGVLASGRADFTLAAGRIVQAGLKRHLYEQVGKEINDFVNKGKLKDNYAGESLGFKSLQELIEFIDSEAPDEDRLRGVRAMFYAVNSVNTPDAQRILMYELLSMAKRLSGSQVRLLAVVYGFHTEGFWTRNSALTIENWLQNVSNRLGHGLISLTELDESELINNKLIDPRPRIPPSAPLSGERARLTDLGIKFCEALKNYDKARGS